METGYDLNFQKLRTVLMHRPGNEINIIDNPKKWLFLKKPSLAKMQKEHDSVADVLSSESVKIIELKKSFKDTPNIIFTRDLGAFLKNGFYKCCLKEDVRKKESSLIENFLDKEKVSVFGKENKSTIEGGDIIFFDKGRILVGQSRRTCKEGIENFKRYADREIIKVPVPKKFIHLDLIFSILSKDVCLIVPNTLPDDFIGFLNEENFTILNAEESEAEKMAGNVFSLSEKKIVSHSAHKKTNKILKNYGFDVIEVDISEILNGGGGINCITLPILRS